MRLPVASISAGRNWGGGSGLRSSPRRGGPGDGPRRSRSSRWRRRSSGREACFPRRPPHGAGARSRAQCARTTRRLKRMRGGDVVLVRGLAQVGEDLVRPGDGVGRGPGLDVVAEGVEVRIRAHARVAEQVPGADQVLARLDRGPGAAGRRAGQPAGGADARQAGADDQHVERRGHRGPPMAPSPAERGRVSTSRWPRAARRGREAGGRRRKAGGAGAARRPSQASQVMRPPQIVTAARAWSISEGGRASRSWDITATSAIMPGARRPLRSSLNSTQALPAV